MTDPITLLENEDNILRETMAIRAHVERIGVTLYELLSTNKNILYTESLVDLKDDYNIFIKELTAEQMLISNILEARKNK